MVRWAIVVVAIVLVVGVVSSGLVMVWWRTPARTEYRVDRRALRRVRRRQRAFDRSSSCDGADPRVRRLDLLVDLAGQACRARRRSTGVVRWIRDWRTPMPTRLDTPFERRYLLEADDLLDELEAGALAPVVDVRAPRPGAASGPAAAESA